MLLLGTSREWFAAALGAVLHSEGFNVVRAGTEEALLEQSRELDPDLVLVDESLRGVTVPELCRRLTAGPLPPHVPLVVYTESYPGDEVHAGALDAGAWEILSEPIRARVLVAALRRLRDLSRRITAKAESDRSRLWDDETGLFTEAGLEHVLPSLEALASRRDVGVSCVVLGPTQVGDGDMLERQRMATADLCAVNVRASDVCAWLGEGEIAIIAFDTPAEGATTLAERLNRMATDRAQVSEDSHTLSAGIVELLTAANGDADASSRPDEEAGGRQRDFARMGRLKAAREALREARQRGGGIRIAEVA